MKKNIDINLIDEKIVINFENILSFEELKKINFVVYNKIMALNGYFNNNEIIIEIDNKEKFNKILNLYSNLLKSFNNEYIVTINDSFRKYIENRQNIINNIVSNGISVKNNNFIFTREFTEFKEIINNTFLNRKLNDFQLQNAYFAYKIKKSANFSVPGSGKTSTLLGLYAFLKNKNLVNNIVVIGPKSSFLSWVSEYNQCFGYDPLFFDSNILKKEYDFLINFGEDKLNKIWSDFDLFLFNYESIDKNQELIKKIITPKTLLIFDESHKIKNPNGKWAKACLNVVNNSIYRVLLTGTPLPNGFEDAFNMLKIIGDEYYNELFGFDINELKIGKFDNNFQILFKEKIYPFFIRTTKKDLNVPLPNDDIIVKYNLSQYEKELYFEVLNLYKDKPFALILRLLQTLSSPYDLKRKIDENELIEYEEESEMIESNNLLDPIINNKIDSLIKEIGISTKLQLTIEIVKKLVKDNKNVLIWTIFVTPMETIKNEISKFAKCEIINGNIDLKKREEIIKKFQNNEINVLIANPQTIAESVSLHHNCHDAIYVDYSYNLTHMLQSRDRIHRLGLSFETQTNYYYFQCENDIKHIEEIIYDSLAQKEIRMNEIINSKDIDISFDSNEIQQTFLSEIYSKLNLENNQKDNENKN